MEVGFRPSDVREDKTEHFFVYVGVLLPRSSLAGLSEVGSLWVTGCPLSAAQRLGGRKPNPSLLSLHTKTPGSSNVDSSALFCLHCQSRSVQRGELTGSLVICD